MKESIRAIQGRCALCIGEPERDAPPGWSWVRLGDIARLESGHTPSREHAEYWDGDIPWVGIRDAREHHGGFIQDTLQKVTAAGIANSSARVLPQNTVCLSRTASVGYVFILGCEMATSQDFVNWVCSDALEPRFLQYLLMAEGDDIRRFGKGSTHTTIYFEAVEEFRVCIPAVSVQRRIVAKLDDLLARSRRAKEALVEIPALLERYRQSVLATACSGALTNGVCEGSEIPTSWRWASISELVVAGGVFDGARDHGDRTPASLNLRTSDYTDAGVRVIRLENVGPLSFVAEKRTYISATKFSQLKQNPIADGDILFASFVNECVRVCLAPQLDTIAITKADCFCVRPRPGAVHPEYLVLQLACDRTYRSLVGNIHGATRPRITTKQLSALRVPICVEEEQLEIVRRVKAEFSRTDSVLAHVKTQLGALDNYERAVLTNAFRGELVPQDPADEPASVLLDRLRAERAAAPSAPRRRGREKRA